MATYELSQYFVDNPLAVVFTFVVISSLLYVFYKLYNHFS